MGLSKKKIGAAIIGTIVAGTGAFAWYAEQLDEEHEALVADQVEVVKAARDISFGTPVTKDRLTTEKVPRKFLPPDPLLESELNIYLGTPVATDVEEGAMLLLSDFSVADAGREIAERLVSPMVIKTASLRLEAEKPADSGQASLDAVTKAGGYIVSSDIHVTREHQSFSMVARVPADEFESVIFGLNDVGVPVERRIRGAGVTADVQRLERELGNQEFLVEGLRHAADEGPKSRRKRSKKIEIIRADGTDTFRSETTETDASDEPTAELARAEHDLGELRGELDELRTETALSTIELSIVPPRVEPPARVKPTLGDQLGEEFRSSARAFSNGFFALMKVVAAVLPFALFSSPVLIAFAVWYRRREPVPRDDDGGQDDPGVAA